MGSRHLNPRLVKTHRNYSVEDISRLFDVHKNTVRNWLKLGLAAVDDFRLLWWIGSLMQQSFLHHERPLGGGGGPNSGLRRWKKECPQIL